MRKTDYISFFKYLLCIYNTGFSEGDDNRITEDRLYFIHHISAMSLACNRHHK